MKPGTDSTDSECGEHGVDTGLEAGGVIARGVIAGVVAAGVVAVAVALIITAIILRKKLQVSDTLN